MQKKSSLHICKHEFSIRIMWNIINWFTGFIIAIIKVKKIESEFSLEDLGCTLTKMHDEKWLLDCINALVESVPQVNGSISVEILNISYTEIHSFQENDFENYTKLKALEMKGLNIKENSMPENLWTPLKQLIFLDISGLAGNFKIIKKLPASIKFVHANDYHQPEALVNFDLSLVENLQELHMEQCSVKAIPKLHRMAPMLYITLQHCSGMEELHYKNFSSYCLLEEFRLDHQTKLTLPKQQENCCGVMNWIKKFRIKGLHPEFHCYNNCPAPDEYTFDSVDLEERHECLVRHGRAIKKFWIYLATGLILFIILLLIAYLAYRLYDRYYLSPPATDKFVSAERVELEIEEEEGLVASENQTEKEMPS